MGTRCQPRRWCTVCSSGVLELRFLLIISALGGDDARWSDGVYLALRAVFNVSDVCLDYLAGCQRLKHQPDTACSKLSRYNWRPMRRKL